jgi:hypothetical protein
VHSTLINDPSTRSTTSNYYEFYGPGLPHYNEFGAAHTLDKSYNRGFRELETRWYSVKDEMVWSLDDFGTNCNYCIGSF